MIFTTLLSCKQKLDILQHSVIILLKDFHSHCPQIIVSPTYWQPVSFLPIDGNLQISSHKVSSQPLWTLSAYYSCYVALLTQAHDAMAVSLHSFTSWWNRSESNIFQIISQIQTLSHLNWSLLVRLKRKLCSE